MKYEFECPRCGKITKVPEKRVASSHFKVQCSRCHTRCLVRVFLGDPALVVVGVEKG